MIRENDPLFFVGQVVGFHGLHGEVKVRLAINSPELILDASCAVVRFSDGTEISTPITKLRLLENSVILGLSKWTDRDSALDKAKVFVLRNELRPLADDEWWTDDLIGLSVYTVDGRNIGTISDVLDGPTQLLEIMPVGKTGNKRILVPFVSALVPAVDITQGRIEVVDLPGLLAPQ